MDAPVDQLDDDREVAAAVSSVSLPCTIHHGQRAVENRHVRGRGRRGEVQELLAFLRVCRRGKRAPSKGVQDDVHVRTHELGEERGRLVRHDSDSDVREALQRLGEPDERRHLAPGLCAGHAKADGAVEPMRQLDLVV